MIIACICCEFGVIKLSITCIPGVINGEISIFSYLIIRGSIIFSFLNYCFVKKQFLLEVRENNKGEKTCLQGLRNIKCADQPVHPCTLLSTFVIRFLESIISKFTSSEISII